MSTYDDESKMPWGKFKGYRMIDIPASYLLWLKDNITSGPILNYISRNMDALNKEIKEKR